MPSTRCGSLVQVDFAGTPLQGAQSRCRFQRNRERLPALNGQASFQTSSARPDRTSQVNLEYLPKVFRKRVFTIPIRSSALIRTHMINGLGRWVGVEARAEGGFWDNLSISYARVVAFMLTGALKEGSPTRYGFDLRNFAQAKWSEIRGILWSRRYGARGGGSCHLATAQNRGTMVFPH